MYKQLRHGEEVPWRSMMLTWNVRDWGLIFYRATELLFSARRLSVMTSLTTGRSKMLSKILVHLKISLDVSHSDTFPNLPSPYPRTKWIKVLCRLGLSIKSWEPTIHLPLGHREVGFRQIWTQHQILETRPTTPSATDLGWDINPPCGDYFIRKVNFSIFPLTHIYLFR